MAKEKTVILSLNKSELIHISSGLGHYFEYLDKLKMKEKSIARKKEHEKVQGEIQKLNGVISNARYSLG